MLVHWIRERVDDVTAKQVPAGVPARGCSCIGIRRAAPSRGGRELGVGAETFRKWVRQDEADRGEAPEKPTSAQLAKFSRLKRDPRHMPPPATCSAPPWQVA